MGAAVRELSKLDGIDLEIQVQLKTPELKFEATARDLTPFQRIETMEIRQMEMDATTLEELNQDGNAVAEHLRQRMFELKFEATAEDLIV